MILGIDYGLRHLGLAISEGEIAQPLATVGIKNLQEGIREVAKKTKELGIDLIVVGISEGKSKARSLAFGARLTDMLRLPVEYIDETLSSHEAESIGIRIAKEKTHARAAAIILQRFLDTKVPDYV